VVFHFLGVASCWFVNNKVISANSGEVCEKSKRKDLPQLQEIKGIILEKRQSRTFHLKDDNYG